MSEDPPRFDTVSVTYGEQDVAPAEGVEDVVLPIHLSTTYQLPSINEDSQLSDRDQTAGEYVYGRLSNPTRQALETRLAALENGANAFAFASGMAAISATVLSTVSPNDHIVAFEQLYGGTKKMFHGLFSERLSVDVTYVDATDPSAVRKAIQPETAIIWLESPTNPLMRLCDIEAIADSAAGTDAILAVDNTFASPYFQNPLSLGADIVVHSTTKYLNGHSDSMGGVAITDDSTIAESIAYLQRVGLGSVLPPFNAYMTLRGIKTLPLRMQQHAANAERLAEYLATHPRVTAVHYPGLSSHPQHSLATRQMSGFGGMLSFELDTDLTGVKQFLASLRRFPLAVSLGGVESLIEHPATMTHAGLSEAERNRVGITDNLLRVSVGVEAVDDLITDLDRGFNSIGTASSA